MLTQGQPGEDGDQGPVGEAGNQGAPGPQGPQGPAGERVSTITVNKIQASDLTQPTHHHTGRGWC